MWRRIKSLLARGGGPSGPRFIIHERYQINIPFVEYDARRPFRILGYLRRRHLLRRGMLLRPRPVSLNRLRRVHDPAYIQSLEKPGAMEGILGSSLDLEAQDRFLDFQRMICGGTLKAAHNALKRNNVAVNLGGGLHHAGPDRGSGFCVFNDVAVAIAFLRDQGHDFPILVIDLDLHDGDGTREIFADDPDVHTFSIHNRDLGEVRAVASTSIALGTDLDDDAYLAAIRKHLPPVVAAFRPGLIFYLAGSDPSVDDRLGDWRITLEGMLERDRFVMDLARPAGSAQPVPTVILLAGGYGPMAWRHGAGFFSWLLTGSSKLDIPLELELPVNHYRKLSRLMKHPELLTEQTPSATSSGRAPDPDNDWGLNDQDLGGAGLAPDTRFLGVYTHHGIELALEEAGLLERLRLRGFRALQVVVDLQDPMGHTLSIRAGERDPQTVMEMKLRVNRRTMRGRNLLSVEWLLIQDTRSSFEISRPLLPGQEFPGLGLLRDTAAALVVVCERRDLDGLVFTPTHFHLASLARPMGFFADPVRQARMLALQHAVRNLRLGESGRAVEDGRVVDEKTGDPAEWVPAPMIIPVARSLRDYFGSPEYESAVAAAGRRFDFRLTPG
ncbi:MAG: histone deacetylase [Candidatus Krumholzibacteriota bacterium]